MQLSNRRWRVISIVPVVGGTILTLAETVLATSTSTPTFAGIQIGIIGVVLIVAGIALFIVSQRAAGAADGSGPPPAD